MILLTKNGAPEKLSARITGFVAIYSAIGVRDDATNAVVGQALAKAPFAAVKSFRRDAHALDATCWLHGAQGCFSLSN
jgi:hypothetical protein